MGGRKRRGGERRFESGKGRREKRKIWGENRIGKRRNMMEEIMDRIRTKKGDRKRNRQKGEDEEEREKEAY